MTRTSRRAGLGGAVAVLVLLGLAVPAWAYFSVSSSAATASGRAAILGTPGVVTTGVSASTVTFGVTAPNGGATPTGYRVARTSPTAVANVCAVVGASGSCTDSSPVSGQTNSYAVYAVLSGSTWESPVPATTSVAVPSADTSAPTTTVSTSPAPNGAGWNSANVTVTLAATDASGVAGTWYTTDGSAPTTSSTAYTGAFGLTSSATVRFFSTDTVGNAETPKSFAVKIDKVGPSVVVGSPAAASTQGGTIAVSGTASDTGSGVSSVMVQYKQGTGAFQILPGTVTLNGTSWSTSWPTATVADGTYSVQALATDVAGNTTTSGPVSVTLKNTFTVTGAPATATAGTPFNLTVTTYPGYSGTKPVTVTGLQASPSGGTATVPTSASFSGGTATISVTPVRSGPQQVTVTDTGLPSMTGTSSTVNVNAGTATRLAWTTFTAQGQVQPASSCYFTCTAVIGNNLQATSNISVTDSLGNIVSDLGASRTVTVSAPTPGGGNPAGTQSLVVPASGAATSGTPQWGFKDNGSWTSYTFTATSSGLAQASLTVKKQ
ncbi:chitobiase/beta-hexosaminidase C-terminal domain-containing protein [Phycicoccus sp. Root101]|uniref:chitobiase/beta-hexosaminidase C-terminal domain-containing protein n=1 Tax=Phycicoccus sp. Root101 TaxID=1736421 RepID=UPI000702D551|nr:chitobiase/beta-hexosaminidase C-terminal domain-containing protein [Phycicoccus sp. Root101]KQU65430.1 hypothetical protein ASC58_18325 [Phycicoccus sp. Root101]